MRGIARLADGRVAILSSEDARLALYEPTGELSRTIGRKGRGPGEQIRVPEPEMGAPLPDLPTFLLDSHVAAGGSPLRIYTSDGDRNEIRQYTSDRDLVRVIRRTTDPVPVTDRSHRSWQEGVGRFFAALGGPDADQIVRQMPRRWLGSLRSFPDPLACHWYISPCWIGTDYFLTVRRDELGEERVEGYRIRRGRREGVADEGVRRLGARRRGTGFAHVGAGCRRRSPPHSQWACMR